MKQEVIIISDLWGAGRAEWYDLFQSRLEPIYNLTFYDACKLGEIDLTLYDQENLHKQFLDFGIDKAILALLDYHHKSCIYIGCSVGGVIAWKVARRGLPVEKLITISSTRLRKETESPDCVKYNFYGKGDQYKPSSDWLASTEMGHTTLLDGSHYIYKDADCIDFILQQAKLI